jgi:hypothetical protein
MVCIAIWIVSFAVALYDHQRVQFVIFFLPFYYLLVVKGWDYLHHTASKVILISTAILISLFSLYPYYFEWDQVGKGNYRAAARYLEVNSDNQSIFHLSTHTKLCFDYYFHWRVPQYGVKREELEQFNYADDQFWLVDLRVTPSLQVAADSPWGQQTDVHEGVSLCTSFFQDQNFELTDTQLYPGRYRIVLCRFSRHS